MQRGCLQYYHEYQDYECQALIHADKTYPAKTDGKIFRGKYTGTSNEFNIASIKDKGVKLSAVGYQIIIAGYSSERLENQRN